MSAAPPIICEKGTMKIAIPMLDGKFCEHFGSARAFLVFEASRATKQLGDKKVIGAPEHEPGSLPKWLERHHVDALVTSAIGERALIMLADSGIEVFLADEDTGPAALAARCIAGQLKAADVGNTRCRGHHHDRADGHTCRQH